MGVARILPTGGPENPLLANCKTENYKMLKSAPQANDLGILAKYWVKTFPQMKNGEDFV